MLGREAIVERAARAFQCMRKAACDSAELLANQEEPLISGMLATVAWQWRAGRVGGEPGPLWAPSFAVSNLMDTFESMLVAEPSKETRSLLSESKSNRETAR